MGDDKKYKINDENTAKILSGLQVLDLSADEYDFSLDGEDEKDVTLNDYVKKLVVSNVLSCSSCSITFKDVPAQRNHFKLDWHRYNLKLSLSNLPPVTEDAFLNLTAKDEVSSISGSESDSCSDDSDPESDKKAISIAEERFRIKRYIKVFFKNQEDDIISVYKCILHSKKETLSNNQLVTSVNGLITNPKNWLIVLLSGGHFAAAVFNNGQVITHKTFHCYTVRAKQGGRQSARDNKGGSNPKSAGASLRRYNEQALTQHVQDIMSTWSDMIKECTLILYRAPGPYNRAVIFGGKSAPLDKTDSRLRSIPFPTRRATFNEVKRIYDQLSTIDVHGPVDSFRSKFLRPEKNLQENQTTKKKSINPKIDRGKERIPVEREIPGSNLKSSSENSSVNSMDLCSRNEEVSFQELEEYECDMKNKPSNSKSKKKKAQTSELTAELTKRNQVHQEIQKNLIFSCSLGNKELLLKTLSIYDGLPLKHALTEEDVFTKEDFVECLNTSVDESTKNTLLHLTSSKGLSEFVTALLNAGADPTIRNKRQMTPYVVAANKETKECFKSFTYMFPDKYDLNKADIPKPLTEEQKKELEEKKKERKKLKKMKEKIKKKEMNEKKEEEKEKLRFLALSDREKCALAAERRLLNASQKPLVLSRCFQCGTDMTGQVPFEYGNNRFCSIPCLKSHRAKTNSYGKEI